MNYIIYAPYIGQTVYWSMADSDLDAVRYNIAEYPTMYDGIMQFYCRGEDRFPVEAEEEEEEDA